MKSLIMFAMMAAVTFAFVGCKKEETTESKLGKIAKEAQSTADKNAKDATKAADKAAGDLQKKLDGALKK
jgi:hypothetical protein